MPEALCAARICVSPERIERDAVMVFEPEAPQGRSGRVLDILPRSELGSPDFPVRDFGERTLLPGPVNCHTHLELSHLRGLTQLGQGFTAWVQSLVAQEMDAGEAGDAAIAAAVAELTACDTAHVADICSRRPLAVSRALEAAGLDYTLCAESFGHAPLPEGALPLPAPFLDVLERLQTRVTGAGHSLYTTSPPRMQRAQAHSRQVQRPFFLHLAEHEEEEAMLTQGGGAMAGMLRKALLPKGWQHPGKRPVAWAQELGLLAPDTVAVHCVWLDEEDIAMLAASGTTVCLCPRSNAAIGVGEAPAGALLAAGVPCCVGTDSLSSNSDLDIWAELRHILQRLQPTTETRLRLILELTSATAGRLPGLRHLGRLQPGQRATWTLLPADLEP